MKSTSTTQENYGQLGSIILFLREYKKRHTQKSSPKRNKKWTAWKPMTEEQSVKFKTEVMINNDGVEDDLATLQKNTENAARKVVHPTRAQREKNNNEYSRECQVARRSCRKVYSTNQVESTQEAGKES